MSERLEHLREFYRILGRLETAVGSPRCLGQSSGWDRWPSRGVYFFFEDGEHRTHSGAGPRVVRVGTHGLSANTKSTLWGRLVQHRGRSTSGLGNHRASIFRYLVGTALLNQAESDLRSWGEGSKADKGTRASERDIEVKVSAVIGAMHVLWLPLDDEPGPSSLRGYVERNAISLLSNFNRVPIDPPSPSWLGGFCTRDKVSKSGLWNQNHVTENLDQAFIEVLGRLVSSLKM